MNEAATTWALVVGLDVYDAPDKSPSLTGAVRDAIEAVKWLRSLGVPDAQILLHASPCAAVQAELDGLGLSYQSGRLLDVNLSMQQLAGVPDGTRLFVFLMGHGLYEPGDKRMFLLREAGVANVWTNMGIEGYIDWFLSLPFARQFLFMDGCLNYPYPIDYRQQIKAGVPVYPPPRIPNNSLVACFAAGQTQPAIEIDGHGAFSKRLFDVLNLDTLANLPPGDPLMSAIHFDWNTGIRTLDLKELIDDSVREQVRDVTIQKGNEQTVGFELYGAAAAQVRYPLIQLPQLAITQLRLSVAPQIGAADVTHIQLTAPALYASCDLPVPPSPLSVPIDLVAPQGVDGYAFCSVQPGRWAASGLYRNFRTDAPVNLVEFQLTPRGPVPPPPPVAGGVAGLGSLGEHTFSVKTFDATGNQRWAMGEAHDAYPRAAVLAGYGGPLNSGVDVGHGVMMEIHEDGPVFHVPGHEISRGTGVVHRWARAVRSVVPPDVVVETRITGPAAATDEARLVFSLPPGSAEALAGALAGQPSVEVHPIGEAQDSRAAPHSTAHSLRELERNPVVDLHAGPTRVRLQLPWGSWTQVLNAEPAQQHTLRLPSSVGNPPLRVLLWKEAPHFNSALLILGDEQPSVQLRLVAGVAPVAAKAELLSNPGLWRVTLPGPTPAASAIIEDGGHRREFLLYGNRGLAVQRGSSFRVEPLSIIDAPEWDLLVAKGELDALAPDEVTRLTQQKWFDPLLGLAGAYALYARQSWGELRIVTGNLQGLLAVVGTEPVDLRLLELVGANHGDILTTEQVQELTSHVGQVPLFRWGVRLGRTLIEQVERPGPELMRWWARLDLIERTGAQSSIWTTWSADPEPPGLP